MDIFLDKPVRLQLDLQPPPGVPPDRNGRWFLEDGAEDAVAAVIGAGFLFVQVGYPPEGSASRLRDFLGRISKSARVALVTAGTGEDFLPMMEYGIREAVFDLWPGPRSRDEAREMIRERGPAVRAARNAGAKTGMLLRSEKSALAGVDFLFEAASGGEFDFMEIPPPPLLYYPHGARKDKVPGSEDYARLAERRSGNAPPGAAPEARIHDAILSRILFPQARGPGFEGCQGAHALIFAHPDGRIFPCVSFPTVLGRIADLADEGFWTRPAVLRSRKNLRARTPLCRSCPDWDLCRGGCPAARQELSAREDPACPLRCFSNG